MSVNYLLLVKHIKVLLVLTIWKLITSIACEPPRHGATHFLRDSPRPLLFLLLVQVVFDLRNYLLLARYLLYSFIIFVCHLAISKQIRCLPTLLFHLVIRKRRGAPRCLL